MRTVTIRPPRRIVVMVDGSQGSISRRLVKTRQRPGGTLRGETRLEMSGRVGRTEGCAPRPVYPLQPKASAPPPACFMVYGGNSLHFCSALHYLLYTLVVAVPELHVGMWAHPCGVRLEVVGRCFFFFQITF